MLKLVVVILSVAAGAASTARASVGEIVLNECSQFPNVDARAIRYRDLGPSVYGYWYYDLVYRKVRTVLLTDGFGRVQCSEQITRSELATARFEISEQFGTREQVASDARAWLLGRAIERCP